MLGKNAIDKRARILSAAVKVFAEHGFHNSKVSEIAKKAKVADGTIYLYFKNKDDILISLFEESLKLLINNMREAVREIEDPLEKSECSFDFISRVWRNFKALRKSCRWN